MDWISLEDLASAQPERLAALKGRMDTLWDGLPPYDASKRTPEDVPMVTRKEKSMLEVLGYVIDDEEDLPEQVEPGEVATP